MSQATIVKIDEIETIERGNGVLSTPSDFQIGTTTSAGSPSSVRTSVSAWVA